VGEEEDEGRGGGTTGDGAGEGGGEETETVGATNCVRPGIWVLRLWKPRPAVTRGDAVVAGPMPGTAVATGGLAETGAGVTETVAPVDLALVVEAGGNVDAPSAAGPVAGVEVRLSVPVLFV
jgi:hypothetical protein